MLLHGPSPGSKGPWQDQRYEFLLDLGRGLYTLQDMCMYMYVHMRIGICSKGSIFLCMALHMGLGFGVLGLGLEGLGFSVLVLFRVATG